MLPREINTVEDIFERWSLVEDSWDTLVQAYRDMGFTDELSDEQRIKEFTDIVNHMNSWIEKAEKAVMPKWAYHKDEAITAIELLKEKKYPTTRVLIVYIRLRNYWTDSAYNNLVKLMMEEVQKMHDEEERDIDGREHYQF